MRLSDGPTLLPAPQIPHLHIIFRGYDLYFLLKIHFISAIKEDTGDTLALRTEAARVY